MKCLVQNMKGFIKDYNYVLPIYTALSHVLYTYIQHCEYHLSRHRWNPIESHPLVLVDGVEVLPVVPLHLPAAVLQVLADLIIKIAI